MTTPPRGFVALMSALVISVVLLLIASGGSLAGFFTRVNSLSFEYKEVTLALADACVSHTLLALSLDNDYSGNATTTLGENRECYTGDISESGGTYTFRTRSYLNDVYTILEVETEAPDFTIVSYEELPTF